MEAYKTPPLHLAQINAIAKKLLQQEGKEFGSGDVAFRDSLKTKYDIQAQYLVQTGKATPAQTIEFYSDKGLTTKVATITPDQRSTALKYELTRAEDLAKKIETGVYKPAVLSEQGAVEVPSEVVEAIIRAESVVSNAVVSESGAVNIAPTKIDVGGYADLKPFPVWTKAKIKEVSPHILDWRRRPTTWERAVEEDIQTLKENMFFGGEEGTLPAVISNIVYTENIAREFQNIWKQFGILYRSVIDPVVDKQRGEAEYSDELIALRKEVQKYTIPYLDSYKRYLLSKYSTR